MKLAELEALLERKPEKAIPTAKDTAARNALPLLFDRLRAAEAAAEAVSEQLTETEIEAEWPEIGAWRESRARMEAADDDS